MKLRVDTDAMLTCQKDLIKINVLAQSAALWFVILRSSVHIKLEPWPKYGGKHY